MPPRNAPPKEMKALKDLACDEYTLILPADKGKATVVMNKADYDAKMLTMLRREHIPPCEEGPHIVLREEHEQHVVEPEEIWPTP